MTSILAEYRAGRASALLAANTCVMAMMDRAGDFQVMPVGQSFQWPDGRDGYKRATRSIPFLGGGRFYMISEATYPEYAVVWNWANRPLAGVSEATAEVPASTHDAITYLSQKALEAIK